MLSVCKSLTFSFPSVGKLEGLNDGGDLRANIFGL